ncbi:MAG: hypothetical protein ACTHK4_05365 [Mycobacteriales bacterium]
MSAADHVVGTPMPTARSALASALEHAADTAEDAARDQHRAAEVARKAAREQDGPADHPDTVQAVTAVVRLLGGSATRLTAAVGSLRRAWAQALADDNLSLRQIGERLGVTHQRVSALLGRPRRDTANRDVR